MINYLRNKCKLISTITELKLEVHNQQQVINTLQEELNKSNETIVNKNIELSNLNSYTNELELKLNKIKVIIN